MGINPRVVEIWGDGKNVIIKYRRDGQIWHAAYPHWPRVHSCTNDISIIKQGYRRIYDEKMREKSQLSMG